MNEESGVVALELHPNGSDVDVSQASTVDSPVAPAPPEAGPAVTEAPGPLAAAPVRAKRHWRIPATIAVAGLVVSGSLGTLLWSTIGQRDSARHQLVVTTASLSGQLRTAQADIAARQLTGRYGALVVGDGGRVTTDYETIVGCKAYSDCRAAAQQMLEDLQAFQSDRNAATVPAALQSADAQLRDSLSAAIAAQQEFIAGLDDDDVNKAKDGAKKVDQAMLSTGKAETALADGLK
jgi:hypothetical protein